MALSDRPYGPTSGAASVANQTSMNAQAAVSGPMPAVLTLVSATETVVPSTGNAAAPLTIAIPPDTAMEQTVLDLFASGYVKVETSGTVTINLYEGTSETVANDTLLGTSGAVTQGTIAGATVIAPFFVHARLIYDSVSGLLCGDVEFYINKVKVAAVTLSNFVGALNNTNSPVATFLLSVASSGATTTYPTTVNVNKFTVG